MLRPELSDGVLSARSIRSEPRPLRFEVSVVFSEVAVSLSTGACGGASGGGGAAAGVGAGFGLELHILLLLLKFVLALEVRDDFEVADLAVHVSATNAPVNGLIINTLKMPYEGLVNGRHSKCITGGGGHSRGVNCPCRGPASRIADGAPNETCRRHYLPSLSGTTTGETGNGGGRAVVFTGAGAATVLTEVSTAGDGGRSA